MKTQTTTAKDAGNHEEIHPLMILCRAGKLFDVQTWIAAGKPVNLPKPANRRHGKSPLEIAIDLGFHSLVQVLLDGGASMEQEGWYCPMNQALEKKRFDIVQLLIEHGYEAKSVDMANVFDTWDPDMMEYFIERGAEVEKGNPMAYALSSRIRTALRVFKKYQERFPSFQEQANIALRHHCKEGNLKWVSLLLWAGANPYTLGTSDYNEELPSECEGTSALTFAALYNHFDVFSLKGIRLDPSHPELKTVIHYLDDEEANPVLMKLLKMGVNPNDQENGGCSTIPDLVNRMTWTYDMGFWDRDRDRKRSIDSDKARERLKTLHILVKHGAKWRPSDDDRINDLRRSLLKLAPDYTVEFVWIMRKYNACTKECIQNLLRTSSIRSLISQHADRIRELESSWP
jgi:hypothetical protein